MKSLPVGIQTLPEIINGGYIYVDKTEYIHKLFRGKYYFLSRPRRFGKSLLVSTLKEIFPGNKELFKRLYIYDKITWEKHPVIHIDFSILDYRNASLYEALNNYLDKIAKENKISKVKLKGLSLKDKFVELIQSLSKTNQVVVLIDEYDKPIIDYIDDIKQAEENRLVLKNFYSVIKPLDAYLKFVFITGVSKFSHVSVFSDLNNLLDITFHVDYACMLGYTQEEMEYSFKDYLPLIEKKGFSRNQLLSEIKKWYNGYSWDGENFVYNPFSVLNFLSNRDFGDYWFRSGTPSFLIKLLKKNSYSVSSLSQLIINKNLVDRYEINNIDITVLLLQTGYLTIKHKNILNQNITLDFPNFEVENSFYNYLFADYIEKNYTENFSIISLLQNSLENNNLNDFIASLTSIFSNITYHQVRADEAYFHTVFFLIIKMLGFNIECEVLTNIGRIDAVIKTKTTIYIIEFKLSDAETALQQIKDKKYHEKYLENKKQIILLGIGFNKNKRNIEDWKVEILNS